MFPSNASSESGREASALIELALREDLGDRGDITSEAILSQTLCDAVLRSKDNGVLAGADVFEEVFTRVDAKTEVTFLRVDGDEIVYGDEVARVRGHDTSILKAERIALNFLGFLSGIASLTRQYVLAARSSGSAVVLDTRKTVPGYRALSKYAVRIGGGLNHRRGLYDMILIKDNHIQRAGSITRAVESARKRWRNEFNIEVECQNLAEVREAIRQKVDAILLDNMECEQIQQAVLLVAGRIKTEASGGMNLEKVTAVSAAGVDYVSIGALTHSAPNFDFSLAVQR